ncbi:hypothetical protein BRD03_08045 [Halobacteriales archaeon QS_9_68_17]|nr:MAG: hypothetical protein BRD03_08045 [Halobacteriales archaeon QS_9_68_17]
MRRVDIRLHVFDRPVRHLVGGDAALLGGDAAREVDDRRATALGEKRREHPPPSRRFQSLSDDAAG